MNLNIENLVRSGVVLVVGLPVALSLTNLTGVTTQLVSESLGDPTREATNDVKKDLAGPCIRFMLSKTDSKLERAAKDDIEEVVGGPVDFRATCNWVL